MVTPGWADSGLRGSDGRGHSAPTTNVFGALDGPQILPGTPGAYLDVRGDEHILVNPGVALRALRNNATASG